MENVDDHATVMDDCAGRQLAVTTANLSSSHDEEGLFYVPPGLVAVLSVIYGSVSVIAVVGNLLVIVVVLTSARMRTVTNYFIANLSIADVMIGCLSIPFQFQAALLQRWDLPEILCPVAPFVKEVSVNVSIMTLTVISVDRYHAIVRPLKPGWTDRTASIIVAIVWAISVVSSLPAILAFRMVWITDGAALPVTTTDGTVPPVKPFCQPMFPVIAGTDTSQLYVIYLVIVQYFLPLCVISVAYARIMYRVWFSKAPGSAVDGRDKVMNRNKKKVSSSACFDVQSIVVYDSLNEHAFGKRKRVFYLLLYTTNCYTSLQTSKTQILTDNLNNNSCHKQPAH